MNIYQYERLSRESQIRIFTLFPSISRGSKLRGRLRVVDIDSDVQYDALSYVWGAYDSSGCVIIDGSACATKCPPSKVFSKHLRRRDKERSLWIDAVCIDQKHDAEKNQQVKMMGDIYRRCNSDLAWLEDPPNADEDYWMDAVCPKNRRVQDSSSESSTSSRQSDQSGWFSRFPRLPLGLGRRWFSRRSVWPPPPGSSLPGKNGTPRPLSKVAWISSKDVAL